MTNTERAMLETFLQYGNFEDAKYLFVGMEEGLAGRNIQHEIDCRSLMHTSKSSHPFPVYRKYVNGKNDVDGWYLTDSKCLDHSSQILSQKQSVTPIKNIVHNYGRSPVMMMMARMHWLLQGNNRFGQYSTINKINFKNYPYLNIPNGDNAMIEFYPFPKAQASHWPIQYQNQFSTKSKYINFYNNLGNIRARILANLYNTFPLETSIVYTGIKNKNFIAYPFYISLGFIFKPIQYTSILASNYSGPILSSHRARPFMIGERQIAFEGQVVKQRVFLTPFFNYKYPNTCMHSNDLDVISTWI